MTENMAVPRAEIVPLLDEFKSELRKLYGSRLCEIILYGSWARNEANSDSDIDIAVVLKGEVRPGVEIGRMIDVITELNLKYGVLLAVYPVSEQDYQTLKSPLLLNLRREGVPA